MIFRLIVGLVTLFSLTGHFILNEAYAEAPANAESIIFSPSHSSGMEVSEREGIITFEVHAFSPILSITINDQEKPVKSATSAVVMHQYALQKGQNTFRIKVKTQSREEMSELILNYSGKDSVEKSSLNFAFITTLGAENISNVYSVPDDESPKSGTKGQLILVPTLELGEQADGKLQVQSIILREKFSDDTHKSEEVQYTQLSTSWIEETSFLGLIAFGVGYTDIWSDNEALFNGKEHDETDIHAYFSSGISLSDSLNLDLKLNVKDKKIHEDPTSEDYDEDATVTTLSAKLAESFFSSFASHLELSAENVDADGKYMDNTVSGIEINLKYSFTSFVVSFSAEYETETYRTEDPLYGKTVNNTNTQIQLKGLYYLTSNLIVSGRLEQEIQTSNEESKEYTNNTAALSLIYVFK